MQMSLNLQSALLARAVCWQTHADDADLAIPFYVYKSLDACDPLDQEDYWTIVNLLESIALVGDV